MAFYLVLPFHYTEKRFPVKLLALCYVAVSYGCDTMCRPEKLSLSWKRALTLKFGVFGDLTGKITKSPKER